MLGHKLLFTKIKKQTHNMKKNILFFYFIAFALLAISCDPDPVTPTYPKFFVGNPLTASPNKIYLITDNAGAYSEINTLSWKADADTVTNEIFAYLDSIELPRAFTLLDDKKMEFETDIILKFTSTYSSVSDGIEAKWLDVTDSSKLKLYWGIPNKELKIPFVTHIHSKGTGKVNQVTPLVTDIAPNNDFTSNLAAIIQKKNLKKNDTLLVNWSYKVYTLK
jgi:hypothetical protein